MLSFLRVLFFLSRCANSVRATRASLGLMVLAGVLSGASSAGLIATINAVLRGGSPALGLLTAGFIALCVALPAGRFFSSFLLLKLSNRAVMELRLELSKTILAAPLRRLEELGSARLLAAMTDDVSVLVTAISCMPMLVIQITLVLGCLVYLGWLSWPLLLLVLAAVVIGAITYQLPMRRAQRYFGLRRADWDSLFDDFRSLTQGTKELKIHAPRREAFVAERLRANSESLMRHSVIGNSIYDATNSWGQALIYTLIGVLLFVVPQLHPLGRDVLTGYVLTVLFMVTPLDVILNQFPTLGRAAVAIQRLEALEASLPTEATQAAVLPAPASASWRTLDLVGVTHAYHREKEDEIFTLGPVDLSLRPGDLVFLVGGNGSGKTTLAKLLVGLYRPEQGHILLDGRPVTADSLEHYRSLFSAVFTDFHLFETLLGLVAPDLDLQAQRYLSLLQLDHKVKVVNGRLSTLGLSQGQRKRLALLTAYLEDRPIYLFDEWAADQDPLFKEIFYRQILPDLKKRGKTVVVISHDDGYYDVADFIVKLNYGALEDVTAHAEQAVLVGG
jgi:putative pyoverdin transport system ATP-binding/permease protein